MQKNSLRQLWNDYARGEMDQDSMHPDPIVQFGKWIGEALDSDIEEPTAMTLATADASGRPSARMVLLKGFNQKGFVFYTNYNSRKGRELDVHPFAALVFYWERLERQVRIEGKVQKVSGKESDSYFSSRPDESRASAIVSPQSEVIPDRKLLEQKMLELLNAGEKALKRPAHWGGYRVKPMSIEFWQGRPGRLHDRIRYTRRGRQWKIERLAP